jgi:8-oxo-dGTP diphosphatase
MPVYRNPLLTVDIIIELTGGIVFVQRKNLPHGWALPGGFVDYGESIERAAVREAREETGLVVELTELLYVYSDPRRDPRHHTVSPVFIARAGGSPRGGDDAASAVVRSAHEPPTPLAFDHDRIVADYCTYRQTGKRPTPARALPVLGQPDE